MPEILYNASATRMASWTNSLLVAFHILNRTRFISFSFPFAVVHFSRALPFPFEVVDETRWSAFAGRLLSRQDRVEHLTGKVHERGRTEIDRSGGLHQSELHVTVVL